jgi:hypothetical protein
LRLFHGSSRVAGGITLALLTGCSGGNIAGPAVEGATQSVALRGLSVPGMSPRGTGVGVHPFIDFAAVAANKGPTIAISFLDPNQSYVDLFTAAGKQVGQLTGFNLPLGMASDRKGDLYVADEDNSRVQIYAPGFTSSPTTLSDAGQLPVDVDNVDNGAYVAIMNQETARGGRGSVSIFKGSTLQRNITNVHLERGSFCAFDGSGDLYVDGADSNRNPFIGVIRHATSGGSTLEQLTTTNTIGAAAAIQVTTTGGRIAILDTTNKAIYTYDPPSGASLGTPARITPLLGSNFPYTFAFKKNMKGLYVADIGVAAALEYAYPAGGMPVSSIATAEAPSGTAVIPSQIPNGK